MIKQEAVNNKLFGIEWFSWSLFFLLTKLLIITTKGGRDIF